jgi:hypothetical protein
MGLWSRCTARGTHWPPSQSLLWLYSFHPSEICDIWYFSTKHFITQRWSYCCDKSRCTMPIETSHTWFLNFSRPVMEIKLKLWYLGMICNIMLFISMIKHVQFLSFPRTTCIYLDKHFVRFSSIVSRGLDHPFLTPLTVIFKLLLYLWCAILHCSHWSPCSVFAPCLCIGWIDFDDYLRSALELCKDCGRV